MSIHRCCPGRVCPPGQSRRGGTGARSKPLTQFTASRVGYVVSLRDRVREVCPEFPGEPDLIHWSVPDPAKEGDSDLESYVAFERILRELETRVGFLLELIDARGGADP